jgi:hypothetical protein
MFSCSSLGGGRMDGEVRLTFPGGDGEPAATAVIFDVATPKTPSSSGIGYRLPPFDRITWPLYCLPPWEAALY